MNTEIYLDYNKYEYKKYFIPEKDGEYNIRLKFNICLTDCSYMFAGCKNIISIKFNHFITKYITNMKYMFYGCRNLQNINLFSFDTRNVRDMDYIFFDCWSLTELDLSFIYNKKLIYRNNIFLNRWDINNPISKNNLIEDFDNKIYILIDVLKEDINKKIYFLTNSDNNLLE